MTLFSHYAGDLFTFPEGQAAALPSNSMDTSACTNSEMLQRTHCFEISMLKSNSEIFYNQSLGNEILREINNGNGVKTVNSVAVKNLIFETTIFLL
jgi:hypothetical protein